MRKCELFSTTRDFLSLGQLWVLVGALLLFTPNLSRTANSNDIKYGKIIGKVVDSETGDGLVGVNVFFEGTTIGTASDLDGAFAITKIPSGTYDLIVSMIGYAKKTVTDIKINPGGVEKLDFTLQPEALLSEDVVVTATLLKNTEASLLKDRQRAVAVSDAISAEAISRSGSGDAAEAMTKVTGASVVDGKYVYVRGLGERYSSTHMNGVELPTADPDKKAVQMDLFPSNLLDNIVTIKTFTPDKPGNFSGGVVDIGTKTFPETFTLSFSSSASYNSQATFADGFLLYPRGDKDWLAVEDGGREIPDLLADPDLVIPSAARARVEARRGDVENAQLLDAASKSFNSIMAPTNQSAPINQSYSFSVGNQRSVFGRPLGYVVGLTYSRSLSFYDDGFVGRFSLGDDQAEALNPELLLADSQGKDEVNWGGLFNFGYKLSPHHKFEFNTMYSRGGESLAREQIGTWPKEFTLLDSTNFFENRVLKYTERELRSFQARGEHYLQSLFGASFDWSASLAENSLDEPDTRFFADIKRMTPTDTSYAARQSGFADPARYFRNLSENNKNFSADLSIPFQQWSGLSSTFKFGGAYAKTDREFRERIFSITPVLTYEGDPGAYFSSENMGVISVDTSANGRINYRFGNTVVDRSKTRNNYDGERKVSAFYGMVDLPVTRRLRFIGGVRYETTDLSAISQDSTQAVGKVDEKDLLPSVNLVYGLGDNLNVRAAYTKTLARPTFREIAPFESFEFINGNFFIGNPELKRTLINNYDLRWEWFMRPGEILAVSGFYKSLTNPIERTIIGGTNGQLKYQNVDDAIVFGVEFEFRKQLDLIHSLLRNFNWGANVTLAKSEIDISENEFAVRQAVNPAAEPTRDLQGQSPFLINLDLSYNNSGTNTNVSLLFNTFGSRLSNVSLGGTPDVFERSRSQLNLTASQGLFKYMTVKFGVKNILNESYKESYRFNGKEFIYQEYKVGRSYSFGLSYSL